MRFLLLPAALSAALLATGCGDKPAASSTAKPKSAAASQVSANEVRALGLHQQAIAYRNQGRFAEALPLLDQVLTLTPDDRNAKFNRAAVLAELDRRPEALAILDALLAGAPNDPDIFQNRASVLADMGRNEEALIEVDKALRAQPEHPMRRLLRGKVLTSLGRGPEALAQFDELDAWLTQAGAQAQRSEIAVSSRLFRAETLEALGRPAEAAALIDALKAEFADDANATALLRKRGRL
jgi:tetratricopeptide (TPR) repeat protein